METGGSSGFIFPLQLFTLRKCWLVVGGIYKGFINNNNNSSHLGISGLTFPSLPTVMCHPLDCNAACAFRKYVNKSRIFKWIPVAVGRQQVYSAEQQTCSSSCVVTKVSASCASVCLDHASLKGSEICNCWPQMTLLWLEHDAITCCWFTVTHVLPNHINPALHA